MPDLNTEKLHVKFTDGCDPEEPKYPRKYTLTHSDISGDLFLSVGMDYDYEAISSLYSRFMRDEVLAEFSAGVEGVALHVDCHVSGGLVLGSASWRYAIFQRHLRQVLQAFYFGDEFYLKAYPSMKSAAVLVHFRSSNQRYNLIERWGYLSDYHIPEATIYATA